MEKENKDIIKQIFTEGRTIKDLSTGIYFKVKGNSFISRIKIRKYMIGYPHFHGYFSVISVIGIISVISVFGVISALNFISIIRLVSSVLSVFFRSDVKSIETQY